MTVGMVIYYWDFIDIVYTDIDWLRGLDRQQQCLLPLLLSHIDVQVLELSVLDNDQHQLCADLHPASDDWKYCIWLDRDESTSASIGHLRGLTSWLVH